MRGRLGARRSCADGASGEHRPVRVAGVDQPAAADASGSRPGRRRPLRPLRTPARLGGLPPPGMQPANITGFTVWFTANPETALPDVPGRQGFHPWYEAGLAWIAEGPPARIHFLPPASIVRIRLRVFAMVADYAVERVKLHLHGHPLPFRVTERDGASCVLETRYASTVPGMNTLTITPPAFIRVRDLDPTSPDPRRLGLAVTSITFAGIA